MTQLQVIYHQENATKQYWVQILRKSETFAMKKKKTFFQLKSGIPLVLKNESGKCEFEMDSDLFIVWFMSVIVSAVRFVKNPRFSYISSKVLSPEIMNEKKIHMLYLIFNLMHMHQITKARLSCYLVLLSNNSKTRYM